MGQDSKIEWTHHTFNAWRGCTKVSEGCKHCYADQMSGRNPKALGIWGPNGTRVLGAESYWRQPIKWNREAKAAGERRRVFCLSLGDVFEDYSGNFPNLPGGVHGGVRCMVDTNGKRLCTSGEKIKPQWPDEAGWRPYTMVDARYRLFDLIDATPWLDWLLLTKRPENIDRMLPNPRIGDSKIFRENIWLGASVENRAAKSRIDDLRACPAAVRFLSVEPLIEDLGDIDLTGIHLVIVGGESGPGARPMHPQWARDIRDQCVSAGVAFFFKQWGAHAPVSAIADPEVVARYNPYINRGMAAGVPNTGRDDPYLVGKKAAGRLLDGRTWDEMPQPQEHQ